MNKRIKKKKLKQKQMRNFEEFIRVLKVDPDCLKRAIENMVKAFHENLEKLVEELKEFGEKMKTELFVGEEVIADGVETEVTATAYDDCGKKVYMVKGSNKDYYFDELRRVSNVNNESRQNSNNEFRQCG